MASASNSSHMPAGKAHMGLHTYHTLSMDVDEGSLKKN